MSDRTSWADDVGRAAPGSDNSAAQNAKSLLWYLMAYLTGRVGTPGAGAWTLVQSCDSTQVKTDGTNLFGDASPTMAAFVRLTSSVFSWYVLRSPAGLGGNGPYYLTVAMNQNSDASPAGFYLSRTLPSGGTTSAFPTAADQTTVQAPQLVNNATTNWIFNCTVSALGDFMLLAGKATTGIASTLIWCFAPVGFPAGPTNRVVLATGTVSSTLGNIISLATGALFSTVVYRMKKIDGGSGVTALQLQYPPSLSQIPAGGDYFASGECPRAPMLFGCVDAGNVTLKIGTPPDTTIGAELMGPKVMSDTGRQLIGALIGPFTTAPIF